MIEKIFTGVWGSVMDLKSWLSVSSFDERDITVLFLFFIFF